MGQQPFHIHKTRYFSIEVSEQTGQSCQVLCAPGSVHTEDVEAHRSDSSVRYLVDSINGKREKTSYIDETCLMVGSIGDEQHDQEKSK